MKRVTMFLLGALLLSTYSVSAQTFEECADINDDGALNVLDMVMMYDVHVQGVPLPPGKGDIDLRQDYTLGDIHYFTSYLFRGYPPGGCPPFPPYTMSTTDDSLFLPSATVVAGSGTLQFSLVFVNHVSTGDLLIPIKVGGLAGTYVIDSLVPGASLDALNPVVQIGVSDSTGLMLINSLTAATLDPGVHILATAYIHYDGSPGGTLSMEVMSPRPVTYLHYLYGNYAGGYDSLSIGIPTVVVASTSGYPTMSVAPDTLKFVTFAGYPDPDSLGFVVQSDGVPFDWFLNAPAWLAVDKMQGTSSDTVYVTPQISGISVGTHHGDIEVYSLNAVGSPQIVNIELELKAQFPSLDANCNGIWDIADIIYQINYMFKSGPQPCSPCDGTWDSTAVLYGGSQDIR